MDGVCWIFFGERRRGEAPWRFLLDDSLLLQLLQVWKGLFVDVIYPFLRYYDFKNMFETYDISIFPMFFSYQRLLVAWCFPHRSTQLPSNPSSVGVSQGRAARGRTLVVSRDLESALADRYGYDRRSWQMTISNGISR